MSIFYNKKFYEDQRDESLQSAIEMIPYLLKVFQPESVLDIGCGVGTWLNVFNKKYNVTEILGVDGEYVNRNMLLIDKNEFVPYNIENAYVSSKKYDLAISMEVGEHLQEKSADILVDSLTNASDFIMFSAALPGQMGTNHINEQWPEYWAKKFIDRGYICVDYIRKETWNIKNIAVWYKQNTLFYIKKDVYENKYKQKLEQYEVKTDPKFLTRIHPDLMLYYLGKLKQTQTFEGFIRYKLYPLKKLILGKRKNKIF